MKKLVYYLLMTITMVAFSACGSDGDDDSGSSGNANMGANNTTDLAVTGGVQTIGMTYATIKGYINFTVPEAYANLGSVYSYGIEYSKSEDFTNAQYESGGSVAGRTFTTTLKNLEVNTKYFYRTYVDNMRGTQTGSFTTQEFSYNGSFNASTSDVLFCSTRFNADVPAASLANETYTIGIAFSTTPNGFDNTTYKRAQFTEYSSESYYYSSSTDVLMATVGNTSFAKYRESNDPFTFIYDKLVSGETYYYAAFIEIGGFVKFGNPLTFTTRKLKGSSFNSGTYIWANHNVGAANSFEEGEDFYLGTSSRDTGLDDDALSKKLPPASVVDELNACKHELIYIDDIFYGVVLTDRNGNEMYLPYGYYITSDVTVVDSFYDWNNYYRKTISYSEYDKCFNIYNYGSENIIVIYTDNKYHPGRKRMIREAW